MHINSKLTGAFAWAGLVVVVGVPAIELAKSRLMPAEIDTASVVRPAAVAVSATDVSPATAGGAGAVAAVGQASPAHVASGNAPTPAAAVAPVAHNEPAGTPTVIADSGAGQGQDGPVDQYIESGKSLPDYLSPAKGADSPTAKPAPVSSAPAAQAAPTKPAPENVMASAPASQAAAAAVAAKPAAEPMAASAPAAQAPATAPAAPEQGGPAVVASVPEATVPDVVAAPAPPPVPMPAAERPKPAPAQQVTEAALKNWKSGTLADFLKQNGLLTPADSVGN